MRAKLVRRVPLEMTYWKSFFGCCFNDKQLLLKAEEKLSKELDAVKIIKSIRTLNILKKIILKNYQRVLLAYNKKGFICEEEEEEKVEKDAWKEFTSKMKSFRFCIEN